MSASNGTTPRLGNAAIALAELGYRVFPVRPGEKTPATANGFYAATIDITEVESTWSENPSYNIGLPTEGLLVVDVDTVDGKPNPWLTPDRADELTSTAGAVAITPRGGRHFFYRDPTGQLRNTTSKIAQNVDTRATGGYVVAAPSATVHGRYQWLSELDRAPEDLPPPPQWLLDELTGTAKPAATPQPATNGHIPEGGRNDYLMRRGGALRRCGMDATEIMVALDAMNVSRCKPPLPTDEVSKIAASVSRYEPDEKTTEQVNAEPLEIVSIGQLRLSHPKLRTPIIEPLLRQGETMNVIAYTKYGKSWLTYGLGLSIVGGLDWLNRFSCTPGSVLLLDNELHRETIAYRVPAVAGALGMRPDEYEGRFDVLSLRGRLTDIYGIGATLRAIPPGTYSVVIIDALYRMLPDGISENDNAAMMQVYNQLDRYADHLGAAIITVHHTSKGSQSDKRVTDVGSGAGAISRAPDTHLILRPHPDTGDTVLEVALRSWGKMDPIALDWEWPLWFAKDGVDLSAITKPTKRTSGEQQHQERLAEKRRRVMDYLTSIKPEGGTRSAIRDGSGINQGLMEVVNSLVKDGNIVACDVVIPSNKQTYQGWKVAPETEE
jgi:hypothetical protein